MFVLCVQKAAEEQSGGKPLKRRPEPNYAARSTVKKCTATGAEDCKTSMPCGHAFCKYDFSIPLKSKRTKVNVINLFCPSSFNAWLTSIGSFYQSLKRNII